MKQANFRKWHRWLGIFLAVFIVLQVGSGLWLTASEIGSGHEHGEESEHNEAVTNGGQGHEGEEESHEHGVVGLVHHAEATWTALYRVALALGILLQTFLGLAIFFAMRRAHKSP